MTQYVDSAYRQVDGGNAQRWFYPVPFTSMREVSSNDIPAGGTAAAAGGQLAKDSTPNLEFTNGDTDSAIRLEWASSNSDAVCFQVPLPPWLDCSQALSVKFYGSCGGTTDAVVVASDAFFDVGDTKVEDNSGTVSGTANTEYTITIAGTDIPIGAKTVSVELTPGAHTTDTFLMYSCWVEGKLLP